MNPGFELTFETGPLPPPGGPVRVRRAVRALIRRGGLWLLVRSDRVGDWKFPGGGAEPGEDDRQTLIRELAEETGYRLTGTPEWAGTAVERSPGRDGPGWLFEMQSFYYWCEVEPGEPGPPALEAYERELGFRAVWTSLTDAWKANGTVAAQAAVPPPWLRRETRVLEELLKLPAVF